MAMANTSCRVMTTTDESLPYARPTDGLPSNPNCILSPFASHVRQRNPENSGGEIRYVSILAAREEIEERLKCFKQDPASMSAAFSPVQVPEGSSSSKRRRKSEHPSRPPKKASPASWTGLPVENGLVDSSSPAKLHFPSATPDSDGPGMFPMNGVERSLYWSPPRHNHDDARLTSSRTPQTTSPTSNGLSSYCDGDAVSNSLQMQQLLAAVRQGLTGSLEDPSRLASLSPGRVTSPGVASSPTAFLASPVRLPSIGHFFGPVSPHRRLDSPFGLDPVIPPVSPDKYEVKPPLLNGETGLGRSGSRPAKTPSPRVKTPIMKNERKRRSSSMDAACILASVAIPRTSNAPLNNTANHPSVSSSSGLVVGPPAEEPTDMPDALPVRASASPFLNGTQTPPPGAVLPPPLSVTIDEQRQSIRLRIKTSAWNASSTSEPTIPPSPSVATSVPSVPPAKPKPVETYQVSPIRVKKKVVKFSPPEPEKSRPKPVSTPVASLTGRKRGRPSLASLALEKSLNAKQATSVSPSTTTGTGRNHHPTVSRITAKELLSDLTTPDSLFVAARFETLDMRAKFDLMPPAVQYEIIQYLPKSWTVTATDGSVSLKPGALGRGDSKLRQHLARWQANLAAGEYDSVVRRKYIDLAVGNLDPWKVENFEPVYGEIMSNSHTPRQSSTAATSSSSSTSTVSSSTLSAGSDSVPGDTTT